MKLNPGAHLCRSEPVCVVFSEWRGAGGPNSLRTGPRKAESAFIGAAGFREHKGSTHLSRGFCCLALCGAFSLVVGTARAENDVELQGTRTATERKAGAPPARERKESTSGGSDERSPADGERRSSPEVDREAAMFGGSDERSSTDGERRSSPEVDREAAMFGGSDEVSPAGGEAQSSPEVDREAAMFGDSDESPVASESNRTAEGRVADRLNEIEKTLELGGRLWLWLEYQAQEEGGAKNGALRSPSFMDLYLDGRPSDRLRAFVQGRLRHDFTVADGSTDPLGRPLEDTRVLLDQMWLKFDIMRQLFVTVGKQRVRWGSGRFWNPTDFLNQQRIDPLAFFDVRLGVSLLRIHLPIESLGWNLYAIANLDGADPIERTGGAFRVEALVEKTEVALSVAVKKDDPIRLGLDVSSGVGPFDLHLELALLHRLRSAFFRGTFDVQSLQLPESFSRKDDWIPQLTLGFEFSVPVGDEDSITFNGEYFFNDAGYSDETLYPVLLAQGLFTPLYVGRHYAGFGAFLNAPGRWDDTTFIVSAIANLSDRTVLTRFDYRLRVLTHLELSAYLSLHLGEQGEFHFSFAIDPVPSISGLENGVRVVAPLLELGVALSMDF